MHAVVTLGALFAIFAAQLLLSIAVSDGAYQIAALQQSQKELARTEDALAEDLAVLNSPQHLVADAASLGMVIATDAAYLRLADGAVLPAPELAIRYGCATMCGLVANSLTLGMTPVTPRRPQGQRRVRRRDRTIRTGGARRADNADSADPVPLQGRCRRR